MIITAEHLHQEMVRASEAHNTEVTTRLQQAYDILHQRIINTMPPGDDDVCP